MAKFTPGQFVMAKNGKGTAYMVNRIIPGDSYSPEGYYDLDNGAVHIQKRALSGRHPVAKIDRYYKVVE